MGTELVVAGAVLVMALVGYLALDGPTIRNALFYVVLLVVLLGLAYLLVS